MTNHSGGAASGASRRLIVCLTGLWLTFFGLALVGHHQLGNTVPDSLFKSLQLFHLHYHPYPAVHHPVKEAAIRSDHTGATSSQPTQSHEAAHDSAPIPLALEIARFGAGLWALALLPAFLGFLFEERVARWWVRTFWRGHVVVCGHCTRTLSLVRDLRDDRRRVVLLGHCPAPRSEIPKGVLYIEGDAADSRLLKTAAVQRATDLVTLYEDDRTNLEILVAADRICEQATPRHQTLRCHAHVGDARLRSGLYQRYVTTRADSETSNRQHLFSYYENAARLLVHRLPLPDAPGEGAPPKEHFVIVGFGTFGRSVALKLVKMAGQLYADPSLPEPDRWRVQKPRITIVDPRGDASVRAFLRAHPQFEDYCDLRIVQLSCDDPDFIELAFMQPADALADTSIIFCLETETVTLPALGSILDVCGTPGKDIERIYVRIAEPERLGEILTTIQGPGTKPELILYAPDKDMFSTDAILQEGTDAMAKVVHENYLLVEEQDRRDNNMPPAAGTPWEQLSEDDRQSNREAADHTWAKLRMLGYELRTPGRSGRASHETPPQLLAELRTLEEPLAKVEHQRWMTWRVLNGWRYGPSRSNDEKLHPDITDYDNLHETTKEKDRTVVRAIPKLLERGELIATKT